MMIKYMSVLQHGYKFSMSLFDVITDIINSVNMLSANKIWGSVGLMLVFMPGIIMGITFAADARSKKYIWSLQLIFILFGVLFPITFPLLHVTAIYKSLFPTKAEYESWIFSFIVAGMGVESSIECFGQILLQMFSILNGYDTTTIQILSIVASFATISMCSMTLDGHTIQGTSQTSQTEEINGEESWRRRRRMAKKGFINKSMKFISLLPCYISTISYRAVSISLIMAFIRYWSIIPFVVLSIGLFLIALNRSKERTHLTWKGMLADALMMVLFNLGTLNATTIMHAVPKDEANDKIEMRKDVGKFVLFSAVWTTTVHTACLSTIIGLVHHNPYHFDHWTKENFLLNPVEPTNCALNVYWIFGSTIVMGFFSLTLLSYKSKSFAR